MTSGDERDPFEDLVLDDDFVLDARVREPSARDRQRRHHREEELRRRLESAPVEAVGAVGASHPAPRSRGGWGLGRTLLVAVAVVAVLVAVRPLVASVGGSTDASGPLVTADEDSFGFDGRVYEFPDPASSSEVPLGRPPTVPDHPSYAFLHETADGGPVAWDPCRPVSLVVDERRAPAGTEGLLVEAIDAVSDATGLTIEVEGPTDEPPSADRPPIVDRYGDRWAPVLVSWTGPEEVAELAGDVAGIGGAVPMARGDSDEVLVSGIVLLDAPDAAEALGHPNGRDVVRSVIVHELAHALGLAHVSDPSQLMHPGSGVVDLGPGDRAGLARLGAGPCAPAL